MLCLCSTQFGMRLTSLTYKRRLRYRWRMFSFTFQSGFRYITILRTFRPLIDDEEAIALFAIKRLLIWLPFSSNRSFAVDAVAVILANNGYRLPQEVSMRF